MILLSGRVEGWKTGGSKLIELVMGYVRYLYTQRQITEPDSSATARARARAKAKAKAMMSKNENTFP